MLPTTDAGKWSAAAASAANQTARTAASPATPVTGGVGDAGHRADVVYVCHWWLTNHPDALAFQQGQ